MSTILASVELGKGPVLAACGLQLSTAHYVRQGDECIEVPYKMLFAKGI